MQTQAAVKKLRLFFKHQRRLPSYQEMCDLFGFASKKTSFDLAQKLISMGIIEKDDTGRLVPKNLFPSLPLLGAVKAGPLTGAEEQLLDTLSIEQYLVNNPERSFLLKVSGDSMIDAGIHGGDMVIIEKDIKPRPGNIVVASIHNEFTLKYFDIKDGKPILMPANKNYAPIVPTDDLEIFGIVVSVIRKYL